jgi:membrane protease YdiL (CAAX protease family)
MNLPKIKMLVALMLLPFLVTGIERFLIKPAVSIFPLPDTSLYLAKVGIITLLLLAVSAFRGNSYGLEITKKFRAVLGFMFLALITISYFFLFSLKLKGFLDSLVVIHLINWLITVFREEFILRGVIQTESSYILKGSFMKISASIWFTSLLFSAWHLVNLTVWPWQTVALQMIICIPSGIILGLIRKKTGNTLLTYLLHISGDLLFFSIYLLIFGKLFFNLF